MPTKTLLTPSEYDEISFVDEGANQDAHILIFKAEKSNNGEGEKKKSQRAKNWVEENHKRYPKGHTKGGHFAPADDTQSGKENRQGKFKGRTKSGRLKGAIRVKSGDTLWAIAEKYLGDGRRWKEIARLNGIKDPRKLPTYKQSGKDLKIPGGTFSHPGSWAGEKPRKNTKEQQARVDRARERLRRKNKKSQKPIAVRKPASKNVTVRKPVTNQVVRRPYRSGSRAV